MSAIGASGLGVCLTSSLRRGAVTTYQPNGKNLVTLGATRTGGRVDTYQPSGKNLVKIAGTMRGGTVRTYPTNGKSLVSLAATFYGGDFNTGGMISVYNKTDEDVVQMYANEYGNRMVGAFNRIGKGRTLKPGP